MHEDGGVPGEQWENSFKETQPEGRKPALRTNNPVAEDEEQWLFSIVCLLLSFFLELAWSESENGGIK